MTNQQDTRPMERETDSGARIANDTPRSASEATRHLVSSSSRLAAVLAGAERLRSVRDSERLAAWSLAGSLERHPETRARMLIDNNSRYQTWGLAERMVDRAQEAIYDVDPPRAVRLARLAVAIAEQADTDVYGAPLAADLRCRAWAALGNAYRCASDVSAATTALERAEDLLLDGTGDPLEEANVLSQQASLSSDLGDYGEAYLMLDRLVDIYRQVGDDALLGRALVQKSISAGAIDPEEGIALIEAALPHLDAERQPRLFICARHNMIWYLNEAGRPEQALMLLEASRGLYRRCGGEWATLRLGWAEARICFNLGRLEEADAGLQVLLREFLDRDLRIDGILIAVDLAACRLARGEYRSAAQLASSTATHLREWGVHQRARDAWALFHQSLLNETATLELARELSAYIQRAWRNPQLSFR